MLDKVIARLGYQKTPALPPTDKETFVSEIASGIGYNLQWFDNWMNRYWNPNPIMRDSGKWTGYRMFEEMDGDAHVYNTISMAKDALLSKPFHVRSAQPGDTEEDTKAAFIAWQFDRIRQLSQKKREILSCLDHGFSVSELIFGHENVVLSNRKIRESGIKSISSAQINNAFVVKDVKTKAPSAFAFDGNGRMTIVPAPPANRGDLMVGTSGSRDMSDEELQHFLVLTHDPRFGSRYGWPLKASMFWDYLMKKAAKIYRMVFIEKYGMPWLKGTYPAGTKRIGSGGTDEFEANLKALQKNSYIMHPVGFSIEFVEVMSKMSTMDVYQNLLDFCDGNISEVALGYRSATGGGAGRQSPAAVSTQDTMRQDKLEMLGLELDSLFNDQFITLLIDANFVPNGLYPYVVTATRPEADIDKAVFRYATLHNIGVPLSLSQIYEETATIKPEPGDELPGAPPGKGATDVVGGHNAPNTNISDGTMKTLDQPPDAMTQGGMQGQPGAPNRNVG